MADDPAHLLFPDDAPKSAQVPEWYRANSTAAEERLRGRHPASQAADDTASRLFASEREPGSRAAAPAGKGDGEDAAELLFKNEAKADYDSLVSGELGEHMLSAFSDGDRERGEAIKAATSALTSDFREAGTDAEELKEAFAVVRQSAGLVPPTPEQREESYAAGLAAIQADGITDAELNAARCFIADLELVSPGVIASLEAHGAGNDPRLIRAAAREARRRGYR